jgi:O-antigen/teichoic acid export membrane protein
MLARGYPRLIFWSGLVSLLVNIALNIILIPRYGISGAAVATSISYTLNFVVLVIAFRYLTGTPVISMLIPRYSDLKLLSRRLRAELADDYDSNSISESNDSEGN